MSKIIEIVVAPNGQTRLQTSGFSGTTCQAASQSLEAALGSRQSEQLTAEYYAYQKADARVEEGR